MSNPRRFLLGLAAFSLLSVFAVNGVLEKVPGTLEGETTLDHSRTLFDFSARNKHDSWLPMLQAHQLWSSKQDPRIYDELFFKRRLKFQYPPTSLMVIQAIELLKLPWQRDFRILNAISWVLVFVNATFVALIFRESWRRFHGPGVDRTDLAIGGAIAFAMTLAFYPVVKAFSLGQIQAWLNTLFTILVWTWLRGHRRTAGVLTAIACAVKPQQSVLLVWALVRRFWRFAAALAVTGVVLAAISILLYGVENHLDYLQVLSHISWTGETFYPNHSVNGLLNRLLDNGSNAVWHYKHTTPYHPVVYWGTLLSGLALIVTAIAWRPKSKRTVVPNFLFALLAFTVASPIAWEHHYGILMPIFAWLTPALRRYPVAGRGTWWLLGVVYIVASNFFGVAVGLADTAFTPIQSYLFFAALAVLGILFRLSQLMTKEEAVR